MVTLRTLLNLLSHLLPSKLYKKVVKFYLNAIILCPIKIWMAKITKRKLLVR